jgi:tRNA 2-thiouridine synthesizing protein D
MADKKTLTFCLMDPPYESSNTTTAFRLLDIALERGHDVTVFTFEGAVALSFAKQTQHPNAVHGRDQSHENHPTTKDWVAALLKKAETKGVKLSWVNCGLCVDERGVAEVIPGVGRGSPGDFLKAANASTNTLVIGTK